MPKAVTRFAQSFLDRSDTLGIARVFWDSGAAMSAKNKVCRDALVNVTGESP